MTMKLSDEIEQHVNLLSTKTAEYSGKIGDMSGRDWQALEDDFRELLWHFATRLNDRARKMLDNLNDGDV